MPLFCANRELTVESGCFCFEKSNTVDENPVTTMLAYISIHLSGADEPGSGLSHYLCSALLLGSGAGFPGL